METKSQRRWFRYSLRTLLVLVTIASVAFCWLGLKMRQSQRQKEAVEAIRKLGGYVAYYHEGRHMVVAPPPPGPVWLRTLAGDDVFSQVHHVRLSGETVTDADLVHLQGLTELQVLVLSGTQITDAALVELQGLTQLEDLFVAHTQVTKKGCQELQKALPNLRIHSWLE
jgi:hypothetical protein